MIPSLCTHFSVCGGCTYQNLDYPTQLEQKQRFIEERFGPAAPIIPCTTTMHWRNKMEFSFSQSRQKERFLGLMMRGRRGKVVSLSECLIAQPWMTAVLKRVQAWWETSDLEAYYPPHDRGTLRTLMVREGIRTGQKMVVLTVSGRPEYAMTPEQETAFVEAVGPCDAIILRLQIAVPKMPTRFEERVLYGKDRIEERLYYKNKEYVFNIRTPSFFQPNTLQAERLYAKALEPLEQESVVWDLYCGTGTLGILAASQAQHVIGVEVIPEAIADAKSNMQANGIEHMTFYAGDVDQWMGQLPPPSTVIIDPPRAGLSLKAIQQLCALKAKKIIYISCNPQTQKMNIDLMGEYRVVGVQPVDQFPHTPHVENIVFLELKP